MPTVDTNATAYNGVNQNGAMPSPQASTPAGPVDPMLLGAGPSQPVNSPSAAGMLSGQSAQPSTQPQAAPSGGKPSFFRRLLIGALAGIAAPAEEAQARIQNAQADTAYRRQQTAQAAQTAPLDLEQHELNNQLAKAQIQAIPMSQAREKAELGYYQMQTAIAAQKLASLPNSQQAAALADARKNVSEIVKAGANFYEPDTSMGFSPQDSGTLASARALAMRLNQRAASSSTNPNDPEGMSYFAVPNPYGDGYAVVGLTVSGQAADKPITAPKTVNLPGVGRFTFQPGTKPSAIQKAILDATVSNAHKAHSDVADNMALVDQIGQGKMPLARMDYLAKSKDGQQLLDAVSQKYPDFDGSKIKSYVKTYQDFTSGRTSVALNSGATALKHLLELRQLNTNSSRIPGTAAHSAFQNKLNTLTGELIRFYGMPDTDKSVNSMKSSLGSMLNRDAAITSQAQSMADKFASYVQTWRNAAPSKAYQAPIPQIDAQAVSALLTLVPDFKTRYPGIVQTATNPQTGQRIYSLDEGKSWATLPIQ